MNIPMFLLTGVYLESDTKKSGLVSGEKEVILDHVPKEQRKNLLGFTPKEGQKTELQDGIYKELYASTIWCVNDGLFSRVQVEAQ